MYGWSFDLIQIECLLHRALFKLRKANGKKSYVCCADFSQFCILQTVCHLDGNFVSTADETTELNGNGASVPKPCQHLTYLQMIFMLLNCIRHKILRNPR